MTTRTRLILAVMGLLGLIAALGCSGTPSSSASASSSATHSLTADEFLREFEKNPETARQKYLNTTIELTGVVQSFRLEYDGPVVYLAGSGDMMGVRCGFAKETEPWAKVTYGQTVKVKGNLPPFTGLCSLEHCDFADLEQNRLVVLSAEQLAEEYATDKAATRKKYEQHGLVVTGEVLKKDEKIGKITLKGTDAISVSCMFPLLVYRKEDSERLFRTIEVGKQVKINGKMTDPFSAGEKEVQLLPCILISQ